MALGVRDPADLDLSDPGLYFNRELSWLQFNQRVLELAEDENLPLLERLRAAVPGPIAAQPVPYRTDAATPGFESLVADDGTRMFPIALERAALTRFEMADFARQAAGIGVDYIGICCGGGPHHVRAMAEEMVRRAHLSQPGTRSHFTDAELWVSPDDYAEVEAAITAASVALHAAAQPPRTDGAVRVSLTAALFRMDADR